VTPNWNPQLGQISNEPPPLVVRGFSPNFGLIMAVQNGAGEKGIIDSPAWDELDFS
jgi:hypothetical protein